MNIIIYFILIYIVLIYLVLFYNKLDLLDRYALFLLLKNIHIIKKGTKKKELNRRVFFLKVFLRSSFGHFWNVQNSIYGTIYKLFFSLDLVPFFRLLLQHSRYFVKIKKKDVGVFMVSRKKSTKKKELNRWKTQKNWTFF